MNLLDENIIASQRELLRSWNVSVRQIGFDFEQSGLDDEQIITLLHRHRRVTFVTRDLGFFERHLCHSRYCIACLAVSKEEVALFVRLLLRHKEFRTQGQRLGTVLQVSHGGIRRWQLGSTQPTFAAWTE